MLMDTGFNSHDMYVYRFVAVWYSHNGNKSYIKVLWK